jgi:hypothetical protein
MADGPDYSRQLADLRRRNRIFWIIVLSYPLGMTLLMSFFPTPIWVALIWMGATLIASLYRNGFRCPRCGQRFFRTGRFSRSCVHCGLPRTVAPVLVKKIMARLFP